MTVQTEQRLLTAAWTDDVKSVVKAIRTFTTNRPLQNGCRVVLFEIEGDRELHVNVTHQHRTAKASGWAGPGITAEGFVHNRRFCSSEPREIVRQIRDMVFAARN